MPSVSGAGGRGGMTPILAVRELRKHYPIHRGMLGREAAKVRAVDDVSFTIGRGETLSLVGESGCGKTTTARCILRAIAPTAGEIRFRDQSGAEIDVARLSRRQLRPLRPQMQMIFQDPFSSLNPRMTIAEIIGEPLLVNGMTDARARHARVAELLELVHLPAAYLNRFPHAFSGGQRQRIGIARALALSPSLIVADEPVSALDVSVQAQIVNLMLELQDRLGIAYLFVAHDLSVVKHVSHRVAVMYLGRIVEMAPTEALFATPRHPYTEALLSAVPVPDPRRRAKRIVLEGNVADPSAPPPGCAFHPRCRYATHRCRQQVPELTEVASGHWVRCLRPELSLQGVAAAVRDNKGSPATL
jgi:oligopeptide/dipeptide ABC transporter ATP-binding protein